MTRLRESNGLNVRIFGVAGPGFLDLQVEEESLGKDDLDIKAGQERLELGLFASIQ